MNLSGSGIDWRPDGVDASSCWKIWDAFASESNHCNWRSFSKWDHPFLHSFNIWLWCLYSSKIWYVELLYCLPLLLVKKYSEFILNNTLKFGQVLLQNSVYRKSTFKSYFKLSLGEFRMPFGKALLNKELFILLLLKVKIGVVLEFSKLFFSISK